MHHNPIRSYVLRQGKMTKAQTSALENHWSTFGLDYSDKKISLTSIFNNNNPVVLEIGFGMGDSLLQDATSNLEKNYLGVEVHKPGVGALINNANKNNLNNLKVINDDVIKILSDMIEDNSLDKVQIYFPDPWHKKKHHKRRLIKQSFLDLLLPKIKMGGILHIATDWENYAQDSLVLLEQQKNLKNTTNGFSSRPDNRPQTKFEKRGEKLGHKIFDLIFEVITD